MKKIFNFIIKIILFLFVIFLTLIMCTFIFSKRNDIPLIDAVSHFQAIGNELVDFTFTDKNSINIITNIPDNSSTTSYFSPVSNNTNNYYYDQLDDTSKIIYNSLETNINNLKKENYTINFSTQFNDLLHKSIGQYELNKSFQSALDAFFYDHPELFYIDLTKFSLNIISTSLGSLTTYTVKISPKNSKNYLSDTFSSEKEVDNAIIQLNNIRTNIINNIKNDNTYNKILKIHNMLANSIEYDSTLSKENSHNIYGALVNKEVVCEGYAKSLKYILDSLDIECILVSGDATNSSGDTESHMWNYVKLNDNWYGIDVTWDDPIIIGGSTKNNIRHDYFLKGKKTFITSHSPSRKISDNGMLFKLPTLCEKNYR